MIRSTWPLLVAGLLAGVLLTWLVTPRPGPDTHVLEELRDSIEVARAQSQRDSIRLAAVDDTLTAYRDTVEAVVVTSSLIASHARSRADSAEAEVRAVLDSLGASTAALDSFVAAHEAEVSAKDAEIAARDRERAILYRRIEAGDAESASLRAQIARHEAVDAEETRIRERLQGALRGAKIRERIAEGTAVLALVVAAVR